MGIILPHHAPELMEALLAGKKPDTAQERFMALLEDDIRAIEDFEAASGGGATISVAILTTATLEGSSTYPFNQGSKAPDWTVAIALGNLSDGGTTINYTGPGDPAALLCTQIIQTHFRATAGDTPGFAWFIPSASAPAVTGYFDASRNPNVGVGGEVVGVNTLLSIQQSLSGGFAGLITAGPVETDLQTSTGTLGVPTELTYSSGTMTVLLVE